MKNFCNSRRVLVLFSLVALLLSGCDSGGDDFVLTGTNNNNNGGAQGNLVFQFTRAQAVVPATTTTLGFEFFNSADPETGALVLEVEAEFANTVTVLNVPTTAKAVVITAYDINEIPVGTFTVAVSVVPGATTTVGLNGVVFTPVTFDAIFVDPNPVNLSLGANPGATVQVEVIGVFSNDDEIIFDPATYAANGSFSSQNAAVATVGASGVVTAVANGSTSLDITYTVNGVQRAFQAPINVSTFAVETNAIEVVVGTTSAPVTALFNFNGVSDTDVTASPDTTYDSDNGDFNANDDGTVTVDPEAVPGDVAIITVTYDNDGVDMVDTFTVTAIAAPESIDLSKNTGPARQPGLCFSLVGGRTRSGRQAGRSLIWRCVPPGVACCTCSRIRCRTRRRL